MKKILTIGLFLIIVALVQPLKIVKVQGISMEPTYRDGQILIAKPFHQVQKNHVYVFNTESEGVIIKRIAATEGETVNFLIKRTAATEGETVEVAFPGYVKGHKHKHNWQVPIYMKIPHGCVWVLGDNSRNSEDSRYIGAVPIENITYEILPFNL